ncbi:DUF429 domain-containing protein [Aeromicrobium sp. Marseille-Q0843]|uniref:DUF429 domain-containing protein n=1 Tax=Aeromicrobium phoceense TaxID=2754045 RepID=A0A838XIN0_9ACTN|nr:DUF429 domain-containing protein [Aeromicrobium phoceense]MBA4608831.1 DUF429 domain-containing protein [Aeromicrobium phoceense]
MATTVGIDLAADAKKTALAEVKWSEGKATVTRLDLGVDDGALLEEIRNSDGRVGIDCPFGWPSDFKDLVAGHPRSPVDTAALRWRGKYTHRATDHWVREEFGVQPLSVSADKLGHVAIRLSSLIARLEPAEDFPLDGSGRIAEVYPAAALSVWDMAHRRYKKPIGESVRATSLSQMEDAGIDLGEFRELAGRSDDAFDAVVCAVVARAVGTDLIDPPSKDYEPFAKTEGWIHVPRRGTTVHDIVNLRYHTVGQATAEQPVTEID